MTSHRRPFGILLLIVLVAALLVPVTASAGQWLRDRDRIMVPRDASEECTVSAGGISVTIFPGCLPDGGPVNLNTFSGPDGEFRAQFSPEYQFEAPVMMDFGTATEVVWNAPGGDVVIQTQDIDGDGVVGEIMIDHFSRYSGWH